MDFYKIALGIFAAFFNSRDRYLQNTKTKGKNDKKRI